MSPPNNEQQNSATQTPPPGPLTIKDGPNNEQVVFSYENNHGHSTLSVSLLDQSGNKIKESDPEDVTAQNSHDAIQKVIDGLTDPQKKAVLFDDLNSYYAKSTLDDLAVKGKLPPTAADLNDASANMLRLTTQQFTDRYFKPNDVSPDNRAAAYAARNELSLLTDDTGKVPGGPSEDAYNRVVPVLIDPTLASDRAANIADFLQTTAKVTAPDGNADSKNALKLSPQQNNQLKRDFAWLQGSDGVTNYSDRLKNVTSAIKNPDNPDQFKNWQTDVSQGTYKIAKAFAAVIGENPKDGFRERATDALTTLTQAAVNSGNNDLALTYSTARELLMRVDPNDPNNTKLLVDVKDPGVWKAAQDKAKNSLPSPQAPAADHSQNSAAPQSPNGGGALTAVVTMDSESPNPHGPDVQVHDQKYDFRTRKAHYSAIENSGLGGTTFAIDRIGKHNRTINDNAGENELTRLGGSHIDAKIGVADNLNAQELNNIAMGQTAQSYNDLKSASPAQAATPPAGGYQKQLADYNQEMAQYKQQLATYNKTYGTNVQPPAASGTAPVTPVQSQSLPPPNQASGNGTATFTQAQYPYGMYTAIPPKFATTKDANGNTTVVMSYGQSDGVEVINWDRNNNSQTTLYPPSPQLSPPAEAPAYGYPPDNVMPVNVVGSGWGGHRHDIGFLKVRASAGVDGHLTIAGHRIGPRGGGGFHHR